MVEEECPELQKLEPYLSQAKGLVFDCDGTLLDTMPTYFESWTRTCNEIGLTFPISRFYALAGMSVPHIFEILIKEQMPDDVAMKEDGTAITPLYCEERKKYHHEQIMKEEEEQQQQLGSSNNSNNVGRNPPIDVVFKIIKKYHTTIPIGIASSGWKDHIISNLQKHNLLQYFTTIVTVEDEEVINGKPHPDMYIIAAKKLGVDVSYCIGFEDADLGMDAIRNAGYLYACDVRLFHDYPRNIEQRAAKEEEKEDEKDEEVKITTTAEVEEIQVEDIEDDQNDAVDNHSDVVNIDCNDKINDGYALAEQEEAKMITTAEVEEIHSDNHSDVVYHDDNDSITERAALEEGEEEEATAEVEVSQVEDVEDDQNNDVDNGSNVVINDDNDNSNDEASLAEEEDEESTAATAEETQAEDVEDDQNDVDDCCDIVINNDDNDNINNGDVGRRLDEDKAVDNLSDIGKDQYDNDEPIKGLPSNDNDNFEKARELAIEAMAKDKEAFFGEELPLSQKEILQSILLAEDAAMNGCDDFTTKDKIHCLDKVHVHSLEEEFGYDSTEERTDMNASAAPSSSKMVNNVQSIGKWFTARFRPNSAGQDKAKKESFNSASISPTDSQGSSFL